jgi:hypothetical protein
MRGALLAATVTLALATAGPAPADMQLGLQNDDRLVLAGETGGLRYLKRVDRVGASWVRVMVPDTRWNAGQAHEYVRAVQQAHADGKRVMATLLAWETTPTPRQWEIYARDVVGQMAPYVDAWSPMNEPNLGLMRAASPIHCEVVTGGQVTPVEKTVQRIARAQRRWGRVRRGRGTHLRRKHGGFRRAHGKREQRRARWRRVTRRQRGSVRTTVLVGGPEERQDCRIAAWGVAYRAVYDEVAAVIRRADPGAKLVVGDLAPNAANEDFMAAFYGVGPPAIRPDALGVHPYYWGHPSDVAGDGRFGLAAIERTRDWAARHDVALWVTEFGYRPEHPTAWWLHALDRMQGAGTRVAVLYDTRSQAWDTMLREPALDAVRNR